MAGPAPHYIPPPPPPPPPGFGEGSFSSKPTSGKAIASLICGLAGIVVCPVALLVGFVLGILGIVETGREGSRSGRGIAIAGTIISLLATVGLISVWVFMFVLAGHTTEQFERQAEAQTDKDQQRILDLMKTYYQSNNNSLGPGGPILNENFARKLSEPRRPVGNEPLAEGLPRVTGTLKIEHLVDTEHMGRGSWGGAVWELTVTGNASATLRARDWNNTVIREVIVQDIGRDLWSKTIP